MMMMMHVCAKCWFKLSLSLLEVSQFAAELAGLPVIKHARQNLVNDGDNSLYQLSRTALLGKRKFDRPLL